ncbi:Hpt domain-containing protein [Flammeovirga sp. SJP92]|uniref:Hpt domain-containing protein n=1 Tax=Flammeovirga sp. SJP92 TaxID=1775430 RepID=UPI0007888C2C|nr:Hpt domain-containing protein [Flammeovirga sp. SJP92]KXX72051.1 hypothetical protein AVL50_02705 [Flammeovirga sp. SJP92]
MLANVDFNGLYDIADGDEEFLFSILLVIEKNLKEYPAEMSALLDNNAVIEFGKKAHKLKSSTAYLGHEELEELLIFMEDAINHDKEDLEAKLKVLITLSEAVLVDIQKKIEELS